MSDEAEAAAEVTNNNLIDLNYLDNYINLFNHNQTNQITETIYRPERFSVEEFDATCITDSMKRGLVYFVKQYNEQKGEEKVFDIIALKNDDIISAFVFVKKYMSCIPSESGYVISIEGICSNLGGSGKKLLGFIIYNALIKNFPLILQVDNGYTNISAYCLYSSMGFKVDLNLLKKCYNFDQNKLVMKLDNTITPDTMFTLEKKQICIHRSLQTEEILQKRQISYMLTQINDIKKITDKRKFLKSLGPNFILELLNNESSKNNIDFLTNILINETVLDKVYSFLQSQKITYIEGGKNKKITKKHIKKYKHKTLRKQKNKHK
jgi:hypothetical protein